MNCDAVLVLHHIHNEVNTEKFLKKIARSPLYCPCIFFGRLMPRVTHNVVNSDIFSIFVILSAVICKYRSDIINT